MQAATIIQKCFRGFCTRLDLAVRWAAAQTIQAAWRSAVTRLRFGVAVHRIILVQVSPLCSAAHRTMHLVLSTACKGTRYMHSCVDTLLVLHLCCMRASRVQVVE